MLRINSSLLFKLCTCTITLLYYQYISGLKSSNENYIIDRNYFWDKISSIIKSTMTILVYNCVMFTTVNYVLIKLI